MRTRNLIATLDRMLLSSLSGRIAVPASRRKYEHVEPTVSTCLAFPSTMFFPRSSLSDTWEEVRWTLAVEGAPPLAKMLHLDIPRVVFDVFFIIESHGTIGGNRFTTCITCIFCGFEYRCLHVFSHESHRCCRDSPGCERKIVLLAHIFRFLSVQMRRLSWNYVTSDKWQQLGDSLRFDSSDMSNWWLIVLKVHREFHIDSSQKRLIHELIIWMNIWGGSSDTTNTHSIFFYAPLSRSGSNKVINWIVFDWQNCVVIPGVNENYTTLSMFWRFLWHNL